MVPATPGEKSYYDLVKTMSEHHDPLPLEIVQRFKFHTRMHASGKPIAAYVAALRALGQIRRLSGGHATGPASVRSERR